MPQQNIAYNCNIINMSTSTHALLLVVPLPSLPPRRPTLPKPNLPRPSLPTPADRHDDFARPTDVFSAVTSTPLQFAASSEGRRATGDVMVRRVCRASVRLFEFRYSVQPQAQSRRQPGSFPLLPHCPVDCRPKHEETPRRILAL